MEIIEKCVLDLHDKTDDFYLLLCGDLNARTASENYNQVQDDYEDVLSNVVNSFPRKSQPTCDTVFIPYYIEFCL